MNMEMSFKWSMVESAGVVLIRSKDIKFGG